ncbi:MULTISPECIES: hypothetical protein [Olsenella]|uniref:hypothetical protein n=1 Tax=Olsenella TaxID=133925 RepID=UPI00071C8908|nr:MULTISPECIES: hypothetical protein [Olsenella]OFK23572.1 hypothetical protein HMPREF2826_04725 [Olsenella sp. HMSC062G07]
MLADVLVIAAVAVALGLSIRAVIRGSSDCCDCASGKGCAAHASHQGRCPAAKDMVANAEKALGKAHKA